MSKKKTFRSGLNIIIQKDCPKEVVAEQVKELIAAGANVNPVNRNMLTPILSSIHFHPDNINKEVIKLLVEEGANIYPRSKYKIEPSDMEIVEKIKHDFDHRHEIQSAASAKGLKESLEVDPENQNVEVLNLVL